MRRLILVFLAMVSLSFVSGCEGAGGGEGGACSTSSDCADGQMCVGGECRGSGGGDAVCASDAACGYGQRCLNGRCVDRDSACASDAQCGAVPGGTCVNGVCSYPQPVGCQGDDDCPGQVCNRDSGECEDPPDPCEAGCEDGDPCTDDACGVAGCEHTAREACCASDAECDDGNVCTADTCAGNACVYAPVGGPDCCGSDAECDDGDSVTVDRCLEGQCAHLDPCATTAQCDDGDTCTVDRCAGGGCLNERIVGCCHDAGDCNDGDPCTADRCIGGGCQYTIAPGCCEADADCDDGNACTTNTCGDDGNCSSASVPGCCASAADCDDGDPCTSDACGAGGACVNTRVPGCCTADLDCDDGTPCTADTCNADQSCTNAWIPNCCTAAADCDDGNACTSDACGAGGLCANTAVPGCCRAAADCDDGDPCTQDRCNASSCEHVDDPACCTADAECNDGDVCTTDRCQNNVCRQDAVAGCCNVDGDCDDGLGYTLDVCDPAAHTCSNEARTTCETDAECDDGDACTEARCEEGACAWYLVIDPACRCALEGDCDADQVCSLAQLDDGGIWGYCFLPAGDLPMGALCDPENELACESGLCLRLMGTYVCFGACTAAGDCAVGGACRSISLPSGGDAEDHDMNVCVAPPISCGDDAACPDDMYCDGFTLPENPGALVLGCLYAEEGLKRVGEPCTADEECNSQFCLPDEEQGGICFGVCDDDGDCGAGQRCYPDYVRMTLTMGTTTTADDREVTMPACAWDAGSFDPCTRESQCAGAEVCYPLLNDTDTAFAPACLIPDAAAAVAPGGVCSTNDECQTSVCVGAGTGRCLQFCVIDNDCVPGTTCEQVTFTLSNDDGSETDLPAYVCVD